MTRKRKHLPWPPEQLTLPDSLAEIEAGRDDPEADQDRGALWSPARLRAEREARRKRRDQHEGRSNDQP